jgi:hypothetical protein
MITPTESPLLDWMKGAKRMPSKTYRIGICKTRGELEEVVFEGDFDCVVTTVSRGDAGRRPSLATSGRPAEPPELEVEEIRDEYSGEALERTHPLYDEIEEKALERASDDASKWWED